MVKLIVSLSAGVLRGSALGFRNLTNYIARSRLETGGFRPDYTLLCEEPGNLVFVDNRIVLHGRAPYPPRYDGRDRWLQRIFVHLDNRWSRAFRPGNGPVLV